MNAAAGPATPTPRRRGRRPAGEDTRAAILDAARAEFAARGYDAVTLRGIARVAGVDPRLVHHYFGGKEDVFVASMDFPIRPSEVIAPVIAAGPEGIGERLVRMFFAAWDTPRAQGQVAAVLGAVLSSPEAARVLREFVTREILARVVAAMGSDDPDLRATLAASQMIGVAVVRYVVKVEPLASAEVEDLVPILAPTVQRYIVGELLPDPGRD